MYQNKSLWQNEKQQNNFPELKRNTETEAVVIGGGIAGILCAYKLSERGIKTVLIEQNKILNGVTAMTTAKITAVHGAVYHRLISGFGLNTAKAYAKSAQKAIDEYEKIISKLSVDCDFKRTDAVLYSNKNSNIIRKELHAAMMCEMDVYSPSSNELPFRTENCIAFKNQAVFSPLKFLYKLSENLTIYENTKAIDIKNDCVITNRGKIFTDHTVVCTHFPFVNIKGGYFIRMHQERSYVLALKNAPEIKNMYICADKSGYNFRRSGDYMILSGCSHRTGVGCTNHFDTLTKKARLFYPHAKTEYKWSTQDCITIDGLPYIGPLSHSMPRVYVATGFGKWGMSTAMTAACIITDMVISGRTKLDFYSPYRLNSPAAFSGLKENVKATAGGFMKWLSPVSSRNIDEIKNGNAAVVRINGEKKGVYKDENGKLHTVSLKCPHMGCELTFNKSDKTWDCPCHGSRFDIDGQLINNPAKANIS